MRKHPVAVAIAFVVAAFVFLDLVNAPVEGQSGTNTAAVSGEKGGQDVFGALRCRAMAEAALDAARA